MAFSKGKEKTGGRKKGSQNVLTKTVKETVLAVFNKLQEEEDTKSNLLNWARLNPHLFYPIAAKLIPTEVNANLSGEINTFNVGFNKEEKEE